MPTEPLIMRQTAPEAEGAEIEALSQAFYPGTPLGLAKRLWEVRYKEIPALKREAEHLELVLREHCIKTGEVLEVEGQPALRVYERVKVTGHTLGGEPRWEWEPVLEFDRKRK